MTDNLFFDTDCLSSFLWINDTNLLEILYSGNIVIPSPVYQELSNPCIPHMKRRTDTLITNSIVFTKNIEVGTDEYKLYRELVGNSKGHKAIGKGEAAGIALAKTYNGILASNNLRDIKEYIVKYNLKHIDTGHILKEGLEKGLISEAQGNTIWSSMIGKNRILPTATFSDYLAFISSK